MASIIGFILYWILCLLSFHVSLGLSTPPSYVVTPGEDLYSIAKKVGVQLHDLEACNPSVKNPALIFPGESLSLPQKDAKSYTVLPGDTLEIIAAKLHVSLKSLKNSNPEIRNFDLIFPEQIINVGGPKKLSCGALVSTSSTTHIISSSIMTSAGQVSGSKSSSIIASSSKQSSSGQISTSKPLIPPSTTPPQTTPSTTTRTGGVHTSTPVVTPTTSEVVVIGGSTFTIGPTPCTITAAGSTYTLSEATTTIVLQDGPYTLTAPKIIFSSTTVTLPDPDTTLTTITTDGLTITLAPTSDPPLITAGPSTSITLVVINSTTLALGSSRATLTVAGEKVTFGSNGITIDSSTLTLLPGATTTTTLSIDGITASLAPTPVPDFGHVPAIISAILPAADAAIASLDSILSFIQSLVSATEASVAGILGVETALMSAVGSQYHPQMSGSQKLIESIRSQHSAP